MSDLSIPVVTVSDGVATTLSTNVAEFFGKMHKDVIRSIETILNSTDEKHKRNFAPMMIDIEIGNGAIRKSKAYRLTRDGFTFLAMGFTGERAQAFKWAYIDAFNRMEAQLREGCGYQGLNPSQQHLIRQAVSKRAKTISAHYQTIYRAIYNRYQIARYDQLPPCELNDCLKFIREVDLSVPEVVKNEQQMPTVHDNVMILSDKDLDRLRGFVYCYKYLFRKEVELFFSFLQGVRSPYAGKFYDSFTDWSLTNIEMMLEKAGYPIKTLDCYKHWEAHQKLERPF